MSKKYVSNQDVTIRLFKSDFLELFSRVHPSIPLIVFIPIIGYMEYRSRVVSGISWAMIGLFFVLGLLVWTFAEYAVHRFVFHFKPPGPIFERIHFLFHGVHHDYPMDSRRLLLAPVVSLPLAAIFYGLFVVVFGLFASAVMGGFLVGYLIYDMTHYAIHHFNMHSPMWLAIKNHHMRHHFQDDHLGYGVSSAVWDKVFGTDFPQKSKGDDLQAEAVSSSTSSRTV